MAKFGNRNDLERQEFIGKVISFRNNHGIAAVLDEIAQSLNTENYVEMMNWFYREMIENPRFDEQREAFFRKARSGAGCRCGCHGSGKTKWETPRLNRRTERDAECLRKTMEIDTLKGRVLELEKNADLIKKEFLNFIDKYNKTVKIDNENLQMIRRHIQNYNRHTHVGARVEFR